MGHRDPRGDLQHADAAGGAGGREGEAGPSTCQPDGSPDYGALTRFDFAVLCQQRFFKILTNVFFGFFLNDKLNWALGDVTKGSAIFRQLVTK